MDQQLYLKYLKEYTLEALEKAGDDISLAVDYLEKKPTPIYYLKDNKEKKAAQTE